MLLKRESTGAPLKVQSIGAPVGAGGEARILAVISEPDLVAKIYHRPDAQRRSKLATMIANPPEDPGASQSHVSIAWPEDRLATCDSAGQFVGFLMPRVSGAYPLFQYYNPASRKQIAPLFSYRYLLRTARNLCAAVKALHARGYIIGDVNESNVLVTSSALITLVDTDSFQATDPESRLVYRCTVGKPEYTPPELHNSSFSAVDRSREHDMFGVAVLLFQTLMEGAHPFAGRYLAPGDPPPYGDRIAAGHFPYGTKHQPVRPAVSSPPIELLHPDLRSLFISCFEDGHHHPEQRPDADLWLQALQEAEAALITCPRNINHQYGSHLKSCPWCDRRSVLAGRDPFPASLHAAAQQAALPRTSRPAYVSAETQAVMQTPATQIHAAPSYSGGTLHQAYQPPSVLLTFVNRVPTNPAGWAALALALLSGASNLFGAVPFGLGCSAVGAASSIWGYRSCRAKPALGGKWLSITALIFSVCAGIASVSDIYFTVHPPDVRVLHMASGAHAVAFLPDGSSFITGTDRAEDQRLIGGMVQQWDAASGRLQQTLSEYPGSVSAMAITADGRRAVVAASSPLASGEIDIVDTHKRGIRIRELTMEHGELSVAVTKLGEAIAAGGLSGAVRVIRSTDRQALANFSIAGEILGMSFSPDGQRLVVASGSPPGSILPGRITCVDTKSWKPVWATTAHGSAVFMSKYSEDGTRIYSCGNNTEVIEWDAASGIKLRSIEFENHSVSAIAIAPGGKEIACALDSGTEDKGSTAYSIEVRSLGNGAILRKLQGHAGPVTALSFSPDGMNLASASLDSTVRLWHIASAARASTP